MLPVEPIASKRTKRCVRTAYVATKKHSHRGAVLSGRTGVRTRTDRVVGRLYVLPGCRGETRPVHQRAGSYEQDMCFTSAQVQRLLHSPSAGRAVSLSAGSMGKIQSAGRGSLAERVTRAALTLRSVWSLVPLSGCKWFPRLSIASCAWIAAYAPVGLPPPGAVQRDWPSEMASESLSAGSLIEISGRCSDRRVYELHREGYQDVIDRENHTCFWSSGLL